MCLSYLTVIIGGVINPTYDGFNSPPPCALLMHSGCPGISSTSTASEAGIAIYRVVLVRQLFGRLEPDYGTFISGISIPF